MQLPAAWKKCFPHHRKQCSPHVPLLPVQKSSEEAFCITSSNAEGSIKIGGGVCDYPTILKAAIISTPFFKGKEKRTWYGIVLRHGLELCQQCLRECSMVPCSSEVHLLLLPLLQKGGKSVALILVWSPTNKTGVRGSCYPTWYTTHNYTMNSCLIFSIT